VCLAVTQRAGDEPEVLVLLTCHFRLHSECLAPYLAIEIQIHALQRLYLSSVSVHVVNQLRGRGVLGRERRLVLRVSNKAPLRARAPGRKEQGSQRKSERDMSHATPLWVRVPIANPGVQAPRLAPLPFPRLSGAGPRHDRSRDLGCNADEG